MSEISRRDFIKGTAVIIGGMITVVIGIPTVAYLIDPALRKDMSEGWIPIGKLEDMPVGTPTPFSFTLVQVNGWERTSTSHGGYVLRKSEAPDDLLILNSRCTHLGCTVNWDNADRVYLCPCHDAKFSEKGLVLDGPPPRPLDRYQEHRVTEDGMLEIYYQA